MGGTTFETQGWGRNALQAFTKLTEEAGYEHGFGGYSGTIAEKESFVEIPVPEGMDAYVFAEKLIQDNDPRISDKWGPAGCVLLEAGIETVYEHEVKATKTENIPTKETRTWKTYYVPYANNRELGKFENKTEAVRFARTKCLELKVEVTVHIEKRITNGINLASKITPVVTQKPKEQPLNNYYFFGWASC
jgi:hypothetical protein